MSLCFTTTSHRKIDSPWRTPLRSFTSTTSYCDGLPLESRTNNARLPPELWLKVFQVLTHVPGIFELSDGRAIEAFSEDCDGIILYGLFDETMKLKLTVSRVCWAWRELVLPLLYEFILIRSPLYARVVSVALSRFKQQQSEERYYGRWIKRLEVFVYDNYWEQESLDALADILELAPNVCAFSDFFSLGRLSEKATRRVVKTLQARCEMGRLRRVDISGAVTNNLHQLLSGTPSLEVLITKRISLQPVSLPNLNTLVIGKSVAIISNELENLKAPNLRNLILHNNALCPLARSRPAFMDHLSSNLKHLRCFVMDYVHPFFRVPDIPGLISLTLEFELRPHINALEKFRVTQRDLERITLVRFPTFSHRTNMTYDANGQRIISGFLRSLLEKENNPSLQTIGFLRHRTYFETGDFRRRTITREGYPYLSIWEEFLDLCDTRGIDVVASVGANDHFWGVWQPFHLGMLPRTPDGYT